jgi:hypothetical protein
MLVFVFDRGRAYTYAVNNSYQDNKVSQKKRFLCVSEIGANKMPKKANKGKGSKGKKGG